MVYGPAAPKGSTTDSSGRTVVPRRKYQGPVRPGTDVETFRRTGRSKSRSSVAAAQAAAAQAAALKAAQQKAAAEAKAKLEAIKAEQEKRRILTQRSRLIARNARVERKTTRDARTGNQLRITTWKKGSDTVRKVENLTKGTIAYNSYGVGRAGSGVRRTAGVIVGASPEKEKPVKFQLPRGFLKKTNVTISKDVKDMIEQNKLSSAINNIKSTKQINTTIQRDLQLGKVSSLLLDVADVVSGGAMTEKKINNDQASLNNRIIKFNDKYNGKELSESEYKMATAEQKYIESEQNKLNTRIDSLVSSKKNKVKNFYQTLSIQKTPRLTVQQQTDVIKARNENVKIQNQIKRNQPIINKKNQQIKEKSSELFRLQNKSNRNILDEIKIFRLKNQINTLQTDVSRLNFELPPKILAGTMPIIPASIIPSGISQVRFVGTQKVGEGGKIVTDLVFKTNKGIMGVARGVSTTVKGNTVSMVAGRFGKVTAKLLKGGKKFTKIKTFFGTEKGIVKSVKFTTDKIKRIAKFIQNKKKTGLLRVIKTNIKGMQQSGIGRVVTVKGRTFFKPFIRFPSGRLGAKLGKGIDLDDFASVSAILTKGDLSAILGKTITMKGRKAEFIGLIKSLSGTSSKVALTSINKQQYSKALQKLFTTVAASVSKTERSGRFATRSLLLASAAVSLSKTIPTVSSMNSAKTTLINKKVVPTKQSIIISTIKQKVISKKGRSLALDQKRKIVAKQNQIIRQINKQKSKVRQLSKSKAKQKQINRAKQQQKLLQKQLQKTKLKQKLVQKQLLKSATTPKPVTPMPIGRKPFPFPIKLPKGFKPKSLSKKQNTYYVVEKVRGKFKKLYPKPLIAKDAKDYAVYSIDNRLSKTAFFIPLGKARKVISPPKQIQGYYSKNVRKVRPYKIKYGKKKQLVNGFIEKRRFFQDTIGEKKQLRTAIRKSRKVKRVVRVKRRLTPQQRKVMLRNLKKARAARIRKIKRRK